MGDILYHVTMRKSPAKNSYSFTAPDAGLEKFLPKRPSGLPRYYLVEVVRSCPRNARRAESPNVDTKRQGGMSSQLLLLRNSLLLLCRYVTSAIKNLGILEGAYQEPSPLYVYWVVCNPLSRPWLWMLFGVETEALLMVCH